MTKTRVLRAITELYPGGVERKIVDVLPRLDRDRFEVSLVCLREPGPLAAELEAAGIRVDCIRFRKRLDPGALRRLAALMRERRIDVVHSHMYRSNVSATVAARMAGVPRIFAQVHNVAGVWESRRQLALDRFLCRFRSGVIAVSQEVRRQIARELRLPGARVPVIYNGVDLSRFAACGSERDGWRADLRKELGAGADDVVFLFAARFAEQKRPQDFAELAERLLREQRTFAGRRAVHFWFAGDGPLRGELERCAQSAAIPGRVHLLGWRDDMPRLLAAADVFVMTSTREGFSNALVEAMACGLAVIATDVGGNAEAVRSGIDGWIVPPRDPEALLVTARRVWRDRALREAFGRAASQRARTFALPEMVRAVEALYTGTAE